MSKSGPVLGAVAAMLLVVGGVAAAQAFQPVEKPAPRQVQLVQPAAQTVTPEPVVTTAAVPVKTVVPKKVAPKPAPVESVAKVEAPAPAPVQRQAVVSDPAPETTPVAPAQPHKPPEGNPVGPTVDAPYNTPTPAK